jgi:hypothetical protein
VTSFSVAVSAEFRARGARWAPQRATESAEFRLEIPAEQSTPASATDCVPTRCPHADPGEVSAPEALGPERLSLVRLGRFRMSAIWSKLLPALNDPILNASKAGIVQEPAPTTPEEPGQPEQPEIAQDDE